MTAKAIPKMLIAALRLIFGLLILFLVLLAIIGSFGHISRMQASPPFDMVEINDGRRLHVLCEGPADAPFVLYDAGAFGIYADGWWIKENLKTDHRVCLYDRAGMGWSDPVPANAAPGPDWHVEDMRRLRRSLGATEPFILIGHSMAGLRLHAFANTYPNELAGLVFVDAARPQTMNLETAQRFVPWMLRAMTLGAGLARVGVASGAAFMLPDELDLPKIQKRDKRRSIAAVRHHKATKAEIKAAFDSWATADWRQETGATQLKVAVYSNSENGGANAPVANEAAANSGFGRVTGLPEESHVSLLNRTNAEKIAADVRAMTEELRQP